MQEDGDDEAPPLVRGGLVGDGAAGMGIGHAVEPAEVRERARDAVARRAGSVRTRPGDLHGRVLDVRHVVHAGRVAGAHVDEDVGGGPDHGVERRVDLDWGAGEDGVFDYLGEEDDQFYRAEDVDYPGDLAGEPAGLFLVSSSSSAALVGVGVSYEGVFLLVGEDGLDGCAGIMFWSSSAHRDRILVFKRIGVIVYPPL